MSLPFDRNEAACKDARPGLFFPVETDYLPAAAKKLCEGCKFVDACKNFAVITNQEYGIWGATTPEDRRKLRRSFRSVPARPRHHH
jgi:WhiB family redox-sensing transcriptional regulator